MNYPAVRLPKHYLLLLLSWPMACVLAQPAPEESALNENPAEFHIQGSSAYVAPATLPAAWSGGVSANPGALTISSIKGIPAESVGSFAGRDLAQPAPVDARGFENYGERTLINEEKAARGYLFVWLIVVAALALAFFMKLPFARDRKLRVRIKVRKRRRSASDVKNELAP